jgi:hypothetical protein
MPVIDPDNIGLSLIKIFTVEAVLITIIFILLLIL